MWFELKKSTTHRKRENDCVVCVRAACSGSLPNYLHARMRRKAPVRLFTVHWYNNILLPKCLFCGNSNKKKNIYVNAMRKDGGFEGGRAFCSISGMILHFNAPHGLREQM